MGVLPVAKPLIKFSLEAPDGSVIESFSSHSDSKAFTRAHVLAATKRKPVTVFAQMGAAARKQVVTVQPLSKRRGAEVF